MMEDDPWRVPDQFRFTLVDRISGSQNSYCEYEYEYAASQWIT